MKRWWWFVACVTAVSCLRPGAAPALDLSQAMREALEANPGWRVVQADAVAAVAGSASAGRRAVPMIELGVVNVPADGGFGEDPMTMKMLGVSQRLRWPGAGGFERRAAEATARSEVAALGYGRFALLGEVWSAYAAAWFATQRALEAMEHQAHMERLVAAARARYASGGGRLDEMLAAEAEAARLRADLALFRAESDAGRARLDAVRGAAPGTTGFFALAALEAPAVPAAPEVWVGALAEDHPRRAAARARAAAFAIAARGMQRTWLPEIEVRGSWGFREPLVSEHGAEPQEDMFSASAGFMFPLLGGGAARREAAALAARGQAAAAEEARVAREMEVEAHALWAQAHGIERAARLLADTVLVARRRIVDAAWSAYGAGQVDLQRVFEASHAAYLERIALQRQRESLALVQGRFLALSGRADLLGLDLSTEGGRR